MALVYSCRVFSESSQCCFQASRAVYPHLRMWQWVLDEWFRIPLAISQIISCQTPWSPNAICACDDDSTRSIRSMKSVVLVFKHSHGLIWPMIVTKQMWFMIFTLLIQDCQYLGVQLSWEGYKSWRLWFHAFETRLQYMISSTTFATIMICWGKQEWNSTQRKS